MTAELDADRRLALAYAPAAMRPALEALWRLDVTLGAVLATGREPMISRIRLAWWREALERLDREPPPSEPILQALAAHALPAGVSGAELAAMEEGWSRLLAEGPPDGDSLEAYAAARGGALFRHSAVLLGLAGHPVEPAGRRWALVDLARRSADPGEARSALDTAGKIVDEAVWPPKLRPLGMLSVLTRRDAARGAGTWEAQGSPGRMLRMLRHRLTGR
jgi:15-cis-phytoene synthase